MGVMLVGVEEPDEETWEEEATTTLETVPRMTTWRNDRTTTTTINVTTAIEIPRRKNILISIVTISLKMPGHKDVGIPLRMSASHLNGIISSTMPARPCIRTLRRKSMQLLNGNNIFPTSLHLRDNGQIKSRHHSK